jgi:TonB family protein
MNPLRLKESSLALVSVLYLYAGVAQAADSGAGAAADSKFAPAAENAQREGDKVFKWILLNGTASKRPVPAAAPEPAASAARRTATPRTEGAAAPAKAAALPQRKTQAAVASAPPPPPASASRVPAAQAAPVQAARSEAPAASASVPTGTPATSPEPIEPPADEPVILVHQVEPEFPVAIVQRLQKGAVLVRFDVQADGSVNDPVVVKSTHPRLNAAAVAAVAQWRFQPLRRAQSASAELAFDIRQAQSD